MKDALAARYEGVRVLVLGASGFIGRWVARSLIEAGASVSRVAREATDLSREGAVTALIDATHPAVVFNLAGYGVDPAERDAALMTSLNARLVAELCERLARDGHRDWTGLRLVHVGSALEYGRATGPIDEGALAEPTTDYGRSKLAGTRHVVHAGTSRGLRAVVARLFSVYGPGEHHHRLLPLLQRAARTRETLGLTLGDQRRDFTYVEDVAEGLLRLGLAGSDAEPEGGGKNRVVPGEIVHVATGRLTSVREFAETAAGILGLKPSALAFGVLPTRPDELRHGPVSVARLETITSWLPRTSIADGIRRSVEHSVV